MKLVSMQTLFSNLQFLPPCSVHHREEILELDYRIGLPFNIQMTGTTDSVHYGAQGIATITLTWIPVLYLLKE